MVYLKCVMFLFISDGVKFARYIAVVVFLFAFGDQLRDTSFVK